MANEKPNTPAAPAAPVDPVKAAAAASAAAAVEAMLPTVVAMLAQQQPRVMGGRPVHQDPGPRCHICGQYAKACGGPPAEGAKDTNHAWISVFPRGIAGQAEFADWFTGVIINGVTYLSNGPGHRIPVPKVAEADINATVAKWSEEEVLSRVGRKMTVSKHNPVTRGDDSTAYV